MNITKPTCAKCAAFNPKPATDEVSCWNLVSFTPAGAPMESSRDPGPGDYCHDHQTAAEDAAQTHAIEVDRHIAESSPEFLTAMSACLEMVETLGLKHPDTTRALMLAMELAPPSLHDFAMTQARELGLMPEADGYTDDGEPVFSLEAIAAQLGISMEEAEQAMRAMLTARDELGLSSVLIDPTTVHRKH